MADARPIGLEELQPGDELLQSALWGRFKERFGWRARALHWTASGRGGTLLTLTRRTPLGALEYVPGGLPLPDRGSATHLLEQLAQRIADRGRSFGADPPTRAPTVVRYDLAWPAPEGKAPAFATSGRLRRAPADVQPTCTVIVDLSGDEQRLLAGMKAKTRYNIRLAQRRGVEVAVTPAGGVVGTPLADWYRLYRATAARHHITAHSEHYFTTLFALAAEVAAPELYLLSATCRGEPVGGIIVSICGEVARYLYGASAFRHRALMGNYALQWAALRVARERGCRAYDLYGISPSAEPDHPWAGLYRFKTGFGGAIEHRCGCWDYPVRPLRYLLLRRAEMLRRDYYASIRPRLVRLRPHRRRA